MPCHNSHTNTYWVGDFKKDSLFDPSLVPGNMRGYNIVSYIFMGVGLMQGHCLR